MCLALNRVQGRIFRLIAGTRKANGLPPLRWYDVLWELGRARDGLRPFAREQLVIFEQSNLARLPLRLVDEGLVTESPSKTMVAARFCSSPVKADDCANEYGRFMGRLSKSM